MRTLPTDPPETTDPTQDSTRWTRVGGAPPQVDEPTRLSRVASDGIDEIPLRELQAAQAPAPAAVGEPTVTVPQPVETTANAPTQLRPPVIESRTPPRPNRERRRRDAHRWTAAKSGLAGLGVAAAIGVTAVVVVVILDWLR